MSKSHHRNKMLFATYMNFLQQKEIKNTVISPDLAFVSKRVGKAIIDYHMLQQGDRVMVAVSGGKDSVALLHIMRHRQRVAPIDFDLVAVHVDYSLPDSASEKLKKYFEEEGFKYHVEKSDFLKGKGWDGIDCFSCSWNRRKVLFQLTEKLGCNKIALGHHMDDIAETILLNLFYHGEIGAMRPRQELFNGKITLIRPLCYVRERVLKRLAKKLNFSELKQYCYSHNRGSKRMSIKCLIAQLEKENKDVVKNIFGALENIKFDYLLDKPSRIFSQRKIGKKDNFTLQ